MDADAFKECFLGRHALIPIEFVSSLAGFDATTLHSMIDSGGFPKSQKLGSRVYWNSEDIVFWLTSTEDEHGVVNEEHPNVWLLLNSIAPGTEVELRLEYVPGDGGEPVTVESWKGIRRESECTSI